MTSHLIGLLLGTEEAGLLTSAGTLLLMGQAERARLLAAAGTLGVSRPASAAGKGDGGGSPDPATISVPFLGANQAGIYRPDFLQQASCFAAFRLLVDDSAGLQLLLQTPQLALGQ